MKKYNELSEGEKRLAVVKFEVTYGDYEHNLLNLAMTEVNPTVRLTSDLMYAVDNVDAVKKAAIKIRKYHTEMRKKLKI